MSESNPCNCDTCIDNIFCNDEVPLAMAYVPMQVWKQVYDAEVGLVRGTLFEQLDKPFLGEEAVKRGR